MVGWEYETGYLVAWAAVMIAAGIVGGLVAGLLGVGGGIVIVPVLYHAMSVLGVDTGVGMKVAVATSLATIIATSAVSVSSHYRRGAIDCALLRGWSIPIFFGVLLGTAIANHVEGWVLTVLFATVALLVAINMFIRQIRVAEGFPNSAVKVVSGIFVGTVSAMMGIGGGTLSVPILSAFGFDIRNAVGTASAIGFVIGIPGTIGYIIAGWGNADLPPFSFGYVNMLAVVALIPLTMAMAPIGATLAHRVERTTLQRCFAAFLALTSARMFADLVG